MLQTTDRGRLGRTLMTAYGAAAYAVFFAVFLYSIGWVEGLVVPRTIDEGPQTPIVVAVMVNLALLSVFAVQHSVMARPWFKDRWTRIVPQPIERSTFVLFATAALALVMWQWHPLPQEIWDVDATPVRVVLYAVSFAGWGLVLASTFAIDHFDLFGLRQVRLRFRGVEYAPVPFEQPWLYTIVRHPLMLGFLLAFWAAPTLTQGHLLFNLATTGYILVGIVLEERDLVRAHGPSYVIYTREVRMLLPIRRRPSR